jgi:hypothetical protein
MRRKSWLAIAFPTHDASLAVATPHVAPDSGFLDPRLSPGRGKKRTNEANGLSAQGQIAWSFKQQRQAGVLEKRTHLSDRTPSSRPTAFPGLEC